MKINITRSVLVNANDLVTSEDEWCVFKHQRKDNFVESTALEIKAKKLSRMLDGYILNVLWLDIVQ